MPSGDAHRSLARALDILELCSLNGSGYTLTQLSQHLGIAKGSISPLLHTLRDRGYLTLDDQDHHYRIGRMAFRIGNTYLVEASALREIYRLMHDIVSVCHETCHLGCLKNGDVYYLKKVETPLRSRTVTVEGRSLRHRSLASSLTARCASISSTAGSSSVRMDFSNKSLICMSSRYPKRDL